MALVSALLLLAGCAAKKDTVDTVTGQTDAALDVGTVTGQTDAALDVGTVTGQTDATLDVGTVNTGADEMPVEEEGVLLRVTGVDIPGKMITACIINNTDEATFYAEYFYLEKKTDEGFVRVEPIEEMMFIEIATELEARSTVEITCDISNYDELTAGTYRLVKSDELTAEFEVIGE